MVDHAHRPPALSQRPYRLAVLVSGRGSNLQAIIDAIAQGRLDATVVGVFSDQCQAAALERVPAPLRWAAAPRDFPNRDDFETALTTAVMKSDPDCIVCAGYMRLLKAPFIAQFAPYILNIHPSLLPQYKGLNTHARALAAGDRRHGASIHVVTAELDAGIVLSQASVPILANDTVSSLAARVLALEHPLLVTTLAALVEQRLQLTLDGATYDKQPLYQPLSLDTQTLSLSPLNQ